jgi:hypothetical protein
MQGMRQNAAYCPVIQSNRAFFALLALAAKWIAGTCSILRFGMRWVAAAGVSHLLQARGTPP